MQAILAASLPDRLLRGQPPALSLLTWGENPASGPRAPTSQGVLRHEELSIHIAGNFFAEKKKKTLKTFILWPLGEYSFYVKLAGRKIQDSFSFA